MAAYRLEPAKTGRSSCRFCGKLIDAGTMRFGSDDPGRGSRWFHVECASKGSPRAFAPFAARAGKQAIATSPPPTKKAAFERNEGLEAVLIADPRSKEAIQVYADWLLERSDPWGAVLQAVAQGDAKKVKKLRSDHRDELTGALAPRSFSWDRGFIDEAMLEARTAALLVERYAELRALRTACLLRKLKLIAIPSGELMETVSANPPALLDELFTWVGPGLGRLSVPSLRTLGLFITRQVGDDLADLFASGSLSGLKTFSIFGTHHPQRTLSEAAIDQLARWPVLGGLGALQLDQGAVDEAGAAAMIARAESFRHLDRISLGAQLAEPLKRRAREVFGRSFVG